MKKVSGTRRLLAVVLTIAMLLQNSAGVLATEGANAVSNLSQEQSTEQPGVNAASEQMNAGAQDGENTDASKKNEAPETTAPETQAPQTDAPETTAPETQVPQTNAPETTAPETTAPETDAPQTDAPETAVPETDAPQESAPQTQESSETQKMPGLTQPDSGPENGTDNSGTVDGTETGSASETNAAGTNSTETEAAESGNGTGADVADGGFETVPAETAVPEQTAAANETGDSAETSVYTAQVENTSVQVKVRGEGVLPEGSAMTAEKVTDVSELGQTIAERLHEEGQSLLGVQAFDITLLDENGVELHQLDGKIAVEMEGLTVPEEAEQIRVYHMTEEGQPEQVKALAKEELSDGVLRFENDRFSVYAVAYVKGEDLNAGIMLIAGNDDKKKIEFQLQGGDFANWEISLKNVIDPVIEVSDE